MEAVPGGGHCARYGVWGRDISALCGCIGVIPLSLSLSLGKIFALSSPTCAQPVDAWHGHQAWWAPCARSGGGDVIFSWRALLIRPTARNRWTHEGHEAGVFETSLASALLSADSQRDPRGQTGSTYRGSRVRCEHTSSNRQARTARQARRVPAVKVHMQGSVQEPSARHTTSMHDREPDVGQSQRAERDRSEVQQQKGRANGTTSWQSATICQQVPQAMKEGSEWQQ